ncbi:Uncharacterized protein T10_6849 [Trichinella papuae]|uniref:Zinc transporter ZIP13 n=1 Tax=Trichinella papuae TaxID=268474 RepID=A0A0V1MUV9_9BILA|nr:Uncharacterized protein T10_6849 [Trichinella papuae]
MNSSGQLSSKVPLLLLLVVVVVVNFSLGETATPSTTKSTDVSSCFFPHDTLNNSEQCEHLRTSWLCCLLAAGVVVSAGVAPALFLPEQVESVGWAGRLSLNRLLSFAVGSLVGDVFLHLLPDIWRSTDAQGVATAGWWTVMGLFFCFSVEKCAVKPDDQRSKRLVAAGLNLLANLVDNFCHGLAIGAGFLVSVRLGALTTFAILVHEIPHEIGDFALLLRANVGRRRAVGAQLATATFGLAGAMTALALNGGSTGVSSAWILPFSAGGFLNVALVQVLPDLLRVDDAKESLWHVLLLLVGISAMAALNVLHF